MKGGDEGRERGRERGYLPGLGVCSYSNKNMRSSLSSSAQLAWYLRRSKCIFGRDGEGERGEDKGRERGEKKDTHSLACPGDAQSRT